MRKLYLSSQIPKSTASILSGMGFVLYTLPPCNALPSPTAAHPDMLMFYDGELITSEEYYAENKALFENATLTSEVLGDKYPDDILFNCFVIDNTLFGRLDCISEKIKARYQKQVNLKQGYAKCSTVVLNKAVITADENIFTAVTKQGFEALKISAGNILLPGYDCGFIGGASIVFDNIAFFFGDVTKHPDYQEISQFCTLCGYTIECDKNYPLTDFGGGIFA